MDEKGSLNSETNGVVQLVRSISSEVRNGLRLVIPLAGAGDDDDAASSFPPKSISMPSPLDCGWSGGC